jgi:hypothetical protein
METDEAVNGREPARMRMDRRIHWSWEMSGCVPSRMKVAAVDRRRASGQSGEVDEAPDTVEHDAEHEHPLATHSV